jgi:hypothetical protein
MCDTAYSLLQGAPGGEESVEAAAEAAVVSRASGSGTTVTVVVTSTDHAVNGIAVLACVIACVGVGVAVMFLFMLLGPLSHGSYGKGVPMPVS